MGANHISAPSLIMRRFEAIGCNRVVPPWISSTRLAIQGAVGLAGAEVGAFEVGGTVGAPCAGTEDAGFLDIVHVDGDA